MLNILSFLDFEMEKKRKTYSCLDQVLAADPKK